LLAVEIVIICFVKQKKLGDPVRLGTPARSHPNTAQTKAGDSNVEGWLNPAFPRCDSTKVLQNPQQLFLESVDKKENLDARWPGFSQVVKAF